MVCFLHEKACKGTTIFSYYQILAIFFLKYSINYKDLVGCNGGFNILYKCHARKNNYEICINRIFFVPLHPKLS